MPISFMRSSTGDLYMLFLVCLSSIVLSSEAHSLQVRATSSIGHDSNPYQLASRHDPSNAGFNMSSLRLSGKPYEWLSLSAQQTQLSYETPSDLADTKSNKASIKLKKIYKSNAGYWITHRLNYRYRDHDKTYLDSEGRIASFDNTDIRNRYDRKTHLLEQTNRFKLNQKHRVYFNILAHQFDYQDFENLTNFDSKSLGGEARWKFIPSKRHTFDLELGVSKREYDDRRARDLQSESIESSDLHLLNTDISVKYKFFLSESQEFWIGGTQIMQEDSHSGYYDSTSNSGFFRVRQKLGVSHSFDLRLSYGEHTYDERAQNIELIEEVTLSSKYQTASYVQQHIIHNQDGLVVTLQFSAQATEQNTNRPDYNYRQSKFATGLTFEY